jgi:hypothetical protein
MGTVVMGLLSHGLAFALGYAIGQPQGRARLAQAGRQAADLAQRPEVVRLREQGKQLAVEQAQSIKQKVVSGSKSDAEGESEGAGSDDRGAAAMAPRNGLRARNWRRRFSRSRTAHFPPSQDPAPPSALAGTTVMEDSEAAVLGTPVVRPPEATPPSTPVR